MTPRSKSPVLAAACLLAAVCSRDSAVPVQSQTGVPHNVIIVCIDALLADHVSAYGYGRPTTPNIDAVAALGVLFERAAAQSDWTVPATASLLTGVYPSDHGAGIGGKVRSLGVTTPPNPIAGKVETLVRGAPSGRFLKRPLT